MSLQEHAARILSWTCLERRTWLCLWWSAAQHGSKAGARCRATSSDSQLAVAEKLAPWAERLKPAQPQLFPAENTLARMVSLLAFGRKSNPKCCWFRCLLSAAHKPKWDARVPDCPFGRLVIALGLHTDPSCTVAPCLFWGRVSLSTQPTSRSMHLSMEIHWASEESWACIGSMHDLDLNANQKAWICFGQSPEAKDHILVDLFSCLFSRVPMVGVSSGPFLSSNNIMTRRQGAVRVACEKLA